MVIIMDTPLGVAGIGGQSPDQVAASWGWCNSPECDKGKHPVFSLDFNGGTGRVCMELAEIRALVNTVREAGYLAEVFDG